MTLNLIKNDRVREKRIVPRFPLKTMAWRAEKISPHALEVKDISYTGMQICCSSEVEHIVTGKEYHGVLSWKGDHLDIKGKVRWVRENDRGIVFGIEFDRTNGLAQELRNFLNIGQIGKRMRVIKNDDFSLEIPGNLKYWLRSDGPGEIFFWQHSDGELSKIQLLFLSENRKVKEQVQ